MRSLFFGLVAATALTPAASAQTFEGSDGIELREVFGTVTIKLEGNGPLTVARSGPGANDLRIREGRAVSILGEFDKREFQDDFRRVMRDYRNGNNRSERAFEEMLEDQPTLTIVAAPGTAIRVVDGAVKLNVEGRAGAVEIDDNAMLLVEMDDFQTGHIEVHGVGDVRVGNIAQEFEGNVHGSGDLQFGNAGSADISVHGSGDIQGRNIAGALLASVHGSGDLQLGDVTGAAAATVHGSGDLELGRVSGGLEASVHGSGDLEAASVSKSLDANVHGSGDLSVRGGSVQKLEVRVAGSGEVDFDGTATTADLSNGGSGSITVGEVDGNISVRGRNIRVGGKKMGKDDH